MKKVEGELAIRTAFDDVTAAVTQAVRAELGAYVEIAAKGFDPFEPQFRFDVGQVLDAVGPAEPTAGTRGGDPAGLPTAEAFSTPRDLDPPAALDHLGRVFKARGVRTGGVRKATGTRPAALGAQLRDHHDPAAPERDPGEAVFFFSATSRKHTGARDVPTALQGCERQLRSAEGSWKFDLLDRAVFPEAKQFAATDHPAPTPGIPQRPSPRFPDRDRDRSPERDRCLPDRARMRRRRRARRVHGHHDRDRDRDRAAERRAPSGTHKDRTPPHAPRNTRPRRAMRRRRPPGSATTANVHTELIRRLRDTVGGWKIPAVHISLFGSAARGDGDIHSDIDLLIARPAGLDPESEQWRAQIDALAEDLRRWTGNNAGIVEIS
ncbi:MAG: nucleotidyltransferase domain-containing protein, partial [Solirubrobacterales bacterium]|nr:nucleotidyltransferase domain-containing protein [Solirubrobacterales bacterium]